MFSKLDNNMRTHVVEAKTFIDRVIFSLTLTLATIKHQHGCLGGLVNILLHLACLNYLNEPWKFVFYWFVSVANMLL